MEIHDTVSNLCANDFIDDNQQLIFSYLIICKKNRQNQLLI